MLSLPSTATTRGEAATQQIWEDKGGHDGTRKDMGRQNRTRNLTGHDRTREDMIGHDRTLIGKDSKGQDRT